MVTHAAPADAWPTSAADCQLTLLNILLALVIGQVDLLIYQSKLLIGPLVLLICLLVVLTTTERMRPLLCFVVQMI